MRVPAHTRPHLCTHACTHALTHAHTVALEDYSVMQGQAHNIEDLGADHILRPGLGDDLIAEVPKLL